MLSIDIETMTQRHRVKRFWEIWKCNISGSWFISWWCLVNVLQRRPSLRWVTLSPRVSPSRAPVFSCAYYFQAPATQAILLYHTITDTNPKMFIITGVAHIVLTVYMTLRLSGHFSILGLVFFVLKSLLRIARQWSCENLQFCRLSLGVRVAF